MCSTVRHDFRASEDTSGICMLSMLNAEKARAYSRHVDTHVEYARLHRLLYVNTCFETKFSYYYKIDVVDEWATSTNCSWIWWIDSDIALVNMNYSIRGKLDATAVLVMTDHHAALNAGAFLMSNRWSRRGHFVQTWKAMSRRAYPFTDNGAMLESIMQFFFPGYVPYACDKSHILKCFHERADDAMGKIKRGQGRFTRGFKTIYPRYGFNNHPCPSFSCHPDWWSHIPGVWGWSKDDVYIPPHLLSNGSVPMFAVHHKHFDNIVRYVW